MSHSYYEDNLCYYGSRCYSLLPKSHPNYHECRFEHTPKAKREKRVHFASNEEWTELKPKCNSIKTLAVSAIATSSAMKPVKITQTIKLSVTNTFDILSEQTEQPKIVPKSKQQKRRKSSDPVDDEPVDELNTDRKNSGVAQCWANIAGEFCDCETHWHAKLEN